MLVWVYSCFKKMLNFFEILNMHSIFFFVLKYLYSDQLIIFLLEKIKIAFYKNFFYSFIQLFEYF